MIDKKKAKEDVYVRKNLRREGKLLQVVRHKHVIQLLEIMETENSYYLVTELCQVRQEESVIKYKISMKDGLATRYPVGKNIF